MTLQDLPGGRALVGLVQDQRAQQLLAGSLRALAESLEKHQRPLGPRIEQRRGGRHQQDRWVTRTGLNRRLGERQEA
jgi:hypothetical protein